MAEPMSGSTSNPASNKVRVRSSHLKYYIHDSNEALRFQLTGELTEVDLPELNGCWLTAKTILRNRRLIIDLSGLKAVDEPGSRWLASMVANGAICIPETFGLQVASALKPGKAKGNLFTRVFLGLRSSRVVPAGSSTQAP